MRLNANKRAAALEEEEGPRKRHASPDEVLNDKEALKRYLERTEQSLECMQREHSILKRSHQNLQEVVSDLQDEAIKFPYEKESYSKARKALARTNGELQTLTKENADLKTLQQSTERHMRRAVDRAKVAQEAERKLLDQLEEMKSSVPESNGLRKQAQSTESATKAAEEKAAMLQQKIDELERSKGESDHAAQDQDARISALETDKAHAEEESSKVNAEQDKLKQENATLEKKVLDLTASNESLHQENDSSSARISSLLEEGNELLVKHNSMMEAGCRLQAEHDELKKAVQQKNEDDANAMAWTRNGQSGSSSAVDFLGIDFLSPNKVFATGEKLGTDLLPTFMNALENQEAALLPQDISKNMLTLGLNHPSLTITPRFMAFGDGTVEPVTLVCEVQPKHFIFLAQHLLLPFRDPRNPHIEPSQDFHGNYARMCLLAQNPEVWFEAAIACRLYGEARWFERSLRDKIDAGFGKTCDGGRRVDSPDAQKKMFKPLWDETVYRLSVFPAFKTALRQWAMDKDPDGLFDRWMPRILRGVPQAEAIHACQPAAPVTAHDDGIDTNVPDANTGIPTGLEILDVVNGRSRRNTGEQTPVPQVAAPAVYYDANVEGINHAEGHHEPRPRRTRWDQAVPAHQNEIRAPARQNARRAPSPRYFPTDNEYEPERPQVQVQDVGADERPEWLRVADRLNAELAQNQHANEQQHNGVDYYAAQRETNNQQRQLRGVREDSPPAPIIPVPTSPRRQQNVEITLGSRRPQNGPRRDADGGNGGGRGRRRNNQRNRQPAVAEFTLGAGNNANDAIQAYLAARNVQEQEPRRERAPRRRGNARRNNYRRNENRDTAVQAPGRFESFDGPSVL